MRRGILLLFLLVAAGCLRSPSVTFYTLIPGGQEETGALQVVPNVALNPVTLPEVVDRPQLVLRSNDHQVQILDTHRWAEPLKMEIARLLAQDLSRSLKTEQVSYYPQNAGIDAQYRVQLDIQRFDAFADQVTVEALWSVVRTADRVRRPGHSMVREKVTGNGYDAVVSAYSRALQKVGADLAQAIRLSYPVPPAELPRR